MLSEHTIAEYYGSTDRVNLNERKFRLAFTYEGYYDKMMKNDPRYTRIINRIRYKKSGVFGEKLLNTHKCTEEDLA